MNTGSPAVSFAASSSGLIRAMRNWLASRHLDAKIEPERADLEQKVGTRKAAQRRARATRRLREWAGLDEYGHKEPVTCVGRPRTANTCRVEERAMTGAVCYRRRGSTADYHSVGALRYPAAAHPPARPDRAMPAAGVRADPRARFQAVVTRELTRWADHLEWLRPRH